MEPILDGEARATVLRVTRGDAVEYLKYGTGTVADDICDEMVRLRWLAGRLPCPAVGYFAAADDAAWLLTAGVHGRTGDAWLADDPGSLDIVIRGSATFLRALHALPIDQCPFDAGVDFRRAAAHRRLTANLVDTEDFAADHAGWSAARLWEKLIALTPSAAPRVVTHGDFSLGNLLLDAGGRVTGIIDVGRLGVADPYQDIAIFWENLAEFGTTARSEFLKSYGIGEIEWERLEFYRCLDEFF